VHLPGEQGVHEAHAAETFANYFIVMQVDQAGWHRAKELP
jgi:hypothetical protein